MYSQNDMTFSNKSTRKSSSVLFWFTEDICFGSADGLKCPNSRGKGNGSKYYMDKYELIGTWKYHLH